MIDKRIQRIYMPMTESGFYILYSLQRPAHGYQISQEVQRVTAGQVTISPGTMYGTLSKMEKDGLIVFLREEDKRRIYQMTDLGREVLAIERQRIARLYRNSLGEEYEKDSEV